MSRWWLVLVLAACEEGPPPGAAETTGPRVADGVDASVAVTDGAARPDLPPLPEPCVDDGDGDGYGGGDDCAGWDCDETNRGVHEGAAEACNGIDEDCDGEVDEGLHSAVCGVGACAREVPNCAAGQVQRCVPGTPVDEVCNNEDDDCDGVVDEGAGAQSCGVGACERRSTCDGGAPGECVPGDPVPEACNGVDDDCNGVLDDGFRAHVEETLYSVLVQHHEGCVGNGPSRIGPECNAAIGRFCATRGCTNTGFGPDENSNDIAHVTCVVAEERQVAYAVLWTQHEVCDGTQERIGPNCNAAIHRWCAAAGFVSGFGPVESGPDEITVACVGAGAEVVVTAYAELTQHHPPCNGEFQRIGPDCNAAIHRYCRSRGAASGYGPVENFDGTAVVVCVSP